MSDSNKDVTQGVESGEYYRDAMRWYGTMYHSPISERAILIIITCLAGIATIMALIGLFMLLPLTENKAMIVRIPESLSKVARVEQMTENPSQDPNLIVMNWFVGNYINVREEYDIDKQQMFFRRVFALSSPVVYNNYVAVYKRSDSPTVRYERHTKRLVDITDISIQNSEVMKEASGNTPEMLQVKAQVKFVATEESPTESRNSLWLADITFRFSKIHVDQVTGAITPMEFKVTGYESKQLGLE